MQRSELLLRQLPVQSAVRRVLQARPDLDALLSDWLARARTAWPKLGLDDEQFFAHVAFVLQRIDPAELDAALADLHVEDLYLACGCLLSSKEALRAFEQRVLPAADVALRRLDSTGTLVDEAKQRLREKLLVKDGDKAPRIASFLGRGDLIGFVKVAAARQGLDVLRREKQSEARGEDDLLERLAFLGDDQEMQQLKSRTRSAFRASFQEALAALAPRERLMLRQSALDGLSIDELAGIYGVHRATVARWLQKTREELQQRTEEALRTRLDLEGDELPAIFALVKSQLDVSLPRLLDGDVG